MAITRPTAIEPHHLGPKRQRRMAGGNLFVPRGMPRSGRGKKLKTVVAE
jgi:hypothetical protein